MTKVRAPMLLDSSMHEVRRLEPASCSLSLNLTPPSTADLTVMMNIDDPVPMRAWVRLYDIHGDVGVYRVSASDTEYNSEEQRLTLEHGITSLRDKVIPSPAARDEDSEIKNEDEDRLYTASEMLSWLLSQQNTVMWQAGTCAATENVILDRSDSSLFEMLLEMMDQLPEYDLSFDQSSFPWTVSIVAKAQTATAEGRLSRNLSTVRVTYDDSELCTRVYYNIKSGSNYTTTHMDADTISTYGVVEGSVYLNTDTKQAEAERIATRYLEKRKEPAISVEIEAYDLSAATGETIDAFILGKLFRLTIPSYGLIVNQWITGLRYSDVYGTPESVTLTLGNRIADIAQRAAKTAKTASSASKSSGGGGGGGVRANAELIKQDRIVLEDYNTVITPVRDGYSVWRELKSELTLDDAMISLFSITRDLVGIYTPEEWDENRTDLIDALRQAGIKIDTTEKAFIEIFAESTIDHQAEISIRVKNNEVITAINLSEEGVVIDAKRVDLGNYATVGTLEALREEVSYLLGDTVTFTGSVWVQGGFSHTSQNLTLLNKPCSWKELTYVKSVSVGTTNSYEFQRIDGMSVTGRLVLSVSAPTDTIYYLGHS